MNCQNFKKYEKQCLRAILGREEYGRALIDGFWKFLLERMKDMYRFHDHAIFNFVWLINFD